jgi:SAM-dependent methyltransferase
MTRDAGRETVLPWKADSMAESNYGSILNYMARLKLYGFADPPIGQLQEGGEAYGMDGEIVKALELFAPNAKKQTLVDIGCGNGGFLEFLVQLGYEPRSLIGVNKPGDLFYATSSQYPELGFIEADAREVPLPADSLDVVTVKNLLYHVDDPERVLAEAQRILKPGGTLLVAGRDPGNQDRLWDNVITLVAELRQMTKNGETETLDSGEIKDYSELTTPTPFYVHFDLRDTEEALQKIGCPIVYQFRQSSSLESYSTDQLRVVNSMLRVPKEGWEIFRLALYSLRDIMKPAGQIPTSKDMDKAIDRVVKKLKFDDQVKDNGYYSVGVEQGFFVCQKKAA